MSKKWLTCAVAALFVSAGLAMSLDASAQQNPKSSAAKASATKVSVKKAPARKAPAKKMPNISSRTTRVNKHL